MADSLKNDIVTVEFAAGEQPTSSKLTGTVAQLKTAVSRISSAVGDLFNEQTHTSGAGSYSLDDRPPVGPNLSRLLGSAGWINPRQIGRIRETYEVTFTAGEGTSGRHFRRKMFKLPYPAILFQDSNTLAETPVGTDIWLSDVLGGYKYNPSYFDAAWSIDHAPGYSNVVAAGVHQKIDPTQQVSQLYNLDTVGKWYLDYKEGILYLAEGLEYKAGSGDSITYAGTPSLYFFEDAAGLFTSGDVGKFITISGATNAANNGTFQIFDFTSATKITIINVAGVVENPFSGSWEIREGFTITYRCDTINDSYDGATLNVIPDQAQTSPLCTVTLVSGSTYSIQTPNTVESYGLHGTAWGGAVDLDNDLFPRDFTATQSSYTTILPAENAMGSNPARLPTALTENLSAGDIIPEGYIRLWDEVQQKVLVGGEFTYQTNSQVYCTGLTLVAGSTRYRLIVPGTSALKTLYHLRQGYFNHRHTGNLDYDLNFDGHRLSHAELIHLFDEGDTREGFFGFGPSEIGPYRNPHPMYLHRYGYKYANSLDDTLNKDNALLGDLVLAAEDDDLDLNTDSRKIIFGNPSTGPQIYYDQSEDLLRFDNKDLYGESCLKLYSVYKLAHSDSVDPNALYAKNICKAWGQFSCDGAGVGLYVLDEISGFNFANVSISQRGTDYVFTVFFTAGARMYSADYAVNVTFAVNATSDAAANYHPIILHSTSSTNSFDIMVCSSTGIEDARGAFLEVNFTVWGRN